MAKKHPDHHDAELALRVYELRREAVMRESRQAIAQQFWPKSFDDVLAVTRNEHPLNRPFRQCATYWEMVYGMVRHGIVNPDYFLESNGEGFFLFAKVAPYLDDYRDQVSPLAFRNTEWAATKCGAGRRMFEVIEARVKKLAASKA
jgi:hypothetical protein